jgi:hypothetical protein
VLVALPLILLTIFNLKIQTLLNLIGFVTDLKILVVLVTKLLRQDLDRLVNGIKPVELWDEG